MAVDPKYANLPGIDLESKDVFECGDLPEDDQHWKPEELKSTIVEKVNVDSQELFEKFSNKYTGQMDFSEQKKGVGYKNIGLGDYETVLQKYNRLKIEVSALSKQIQDIKSNKKNSEGEVKLLDRIKDLENQLLAEDVQNLQNEDISKEADVEKAFSTIKSIQAKAASKKESSTSEKGTFEVYLKTNQGQSSMEQFLQLEQRLSKLENTVGLDKEDINVLVNHAAKSKTLAGTVQMMETKLELLDPEKLPLVDTRLQSILVKINEINKTKKGESVAEQNKKIDDLYNMMQRWDSVSSALPKIHKRLMDLHVVQDKACSFLTNLQHLESVQEKLTAQLSKAEVCQTALQERLKSNLATIQANMAEMNKKFESLKN